MSLSGLSLIHPAALWGMAALLIPILIHLFSRSRGRLVRIGHIGLIKNAKKLKVTEVKLTQWLLLLLRLALFALAGLILAGLAQPGLQSSRLNTAYVTPDWLNTSDTQQVADLLEQYADPQTSQVHILLDGFPLLTETSATAIKQQSETSPDRYNLWPLLTERLSLQQHLGEVHVYATDLLQQFGSQQPQLPREVNWHLSHPLVQETASKASIKALIAFDASHQEDANNIRAALISLQAHRLPGLSWELAETGALSGDQLDYDWLIFLADNQIAEAQLKKLHKQVTILSDATVTNDSEQLSAQATHSESLRLPFYPFSEFSIGQFGQAHEDLHDIMTGADGDPVIQTGRQGNARVVYFNSRFNPAWSSITEQVEFPELLLQLMQDNQLQTSFADARVLPSQLQANVSTESGQIQMPRRSLQQVLAVLLVLLWLTERWLSERRRT